MNDAHSVNESVTASVLARVVDEYAERLERGDMPDVQEWTDRYPEYDAVIRQVIRSLEVVHAASVGAPLDSTRSDARSQEPLPTDARLGDFQIVREIGRGGMGVVYEARQLSLDRIVALKVLPTAIGLDSVRRKRFQIEMQAAATLQHPHIVPIYATGCEGGVHFYAMQLLHGSSLDQYVRPPAAAQTSPGNSSHPSGSTAAHTLQPTLTDRDVAHIGQAIADALQHAHEHGIVHRDIKPSNLLLDHHQQAWIMDFGLAHMETEATLTNAGDMVGTLRYMSPEQAQGQLGAVDHRSDVYSLGATLYELLTHQPMYPGNDAQQILRQVVTEDPTPPRRVRPSLAGDLETIVLKAVSKNRDERYGSAAAMAEDLRRFLCDLPITAKPPSWYHRTVKWARRHRTLVVAGSLLLLLASIGSLVSTIAISAQRNRAEKALLAALDNAELARAEARKAKAVSELLQQMLEAGNPDKLKGTEYTVRQLLDDVSAGLLHQLDDQPEVAASLRATIGNAYRRLGAPQKAADLLLQTLTTTRARSGEQGIETARCLEDLAWNEAARGQYEVAIPYARQALSIYERHEVALDIRLHARWCLQHCLLYGRHFSESDAVANGSLQACASLSPPPPVLASVLHNLAQSHVMQEQFVDAERVARQAVDLHRAVNGQEHVETGWGLDALGRSLQGQGRLGEAAEVFHEALAIFRKHYAPNHKSIKYTHELLLNLERQLGDNDAVRQLQDEQYALALRQQGLASFDSGSILHAWKTRGHVEAAARIVLDQIDTLTDAESCREAAEVLGQYIERQGGPRAPESVAAQLEQVAKCEERLVARLVELCPNEPGKQNDLAWWVATLPGCTPDLATKAIALAENAITSDPSSGYYWNTLGLALYRAERSAEARDAIRKALDDQVADAYDYIILAMALQRLGDQEEAAEHYRHAERLLPEPAQRPTDLEQLWQEARENFSNLRPDSQTAIHAGNTPSDNHDGKR